MPNFSTINPFKFPAQNVTVCVQDQTLNGYKIMDKKKKIVLYNVVGKSSPLGDKFQISRANDGVLLGSIQQSKKEAKYRLMGTHDQEL
ncbi:MAG: hypothetical protein OEZ01_07760, partial [Candidatus Heimdallarchaeota archaeon]|nr:hypothetical protein [Candidatus Heimdallarchaeota archaeon]